MEAVVFAGRNALDDYGLRTAVVRIPEVGIRIREAQSAVDEFGKGQRFDLFSFIVSGNETYLRNINLKSLASAVVQIGLYDRYTRGNQTKPDFILGTINNESAARVCCGLISLEDMIAENVEVAAEPKKISVLEAGASNKDPLLSGISLTEYSVFKRASDPQAAGGLYESTGLSDMDFVKLITPLIEKEGVKRFVNIGPGDHSLVQTLRQNFEFYDIEVSESVDLDPMLTWFWREINETSQVAYC